MPTCSGVCRTERPIAINLSRRRSRQDRIISFSSSSDHSVSSPSAPQSRFAIKTATKLCSQGVKTVRSTDTMKVVRRVQLNATAQRNLKRRACWEDKERCDLVIRKGQILQFWTLLEFNKTQVRAKGDDQHRGSRRFVGQDHCRQPPLRCLFGVLPKDSSQANSVAAPPTHPIKFLSNLRYENITNGGSMFGLDAANRLGARSRYVLFMFSSETKCGPPGVIIMLST